MNSKPPSTLERILFETVCTETAGDMEPIRCACGITNALPAESGPLRFGRILGAVIVVGCKGPDGSSCPAASQFGNLTWEHRHSIARFLRGMTEQLTRDRDQLLGALPAEIGEPTH
jgi:hypothetical protein